MPTPTQSQPLPREGTPTLPALEIRSASGSYGFEIGYRVRTEFSPLEGGGTRMRAIADPKGDAWYCIASIPGMGNPAQLRETAAFIVTALNSHPALLAQNKAMREALEACVTESGALAFRNISFARQRLEAINAEARAALSMEGTK